MALILHLRETPPDSVRFLPGLSGSQEDPGAHTFPKRGDLACSASIIFVKRYSLCARLT